MSAAKFTMTMMEMERQLIGLAMKSTYEAVKKELAPLGETRAASIAARITLAVKRDLTK